jgi:hypothetical protein
MTFFHQGILGKFFLVGTSNVFDGIEGKFANPNILIIGTKNHELRMLIPKQDPSSS